MDKKLNILFDGNYLIHRCFSVWQMYYQDRKLSPEENQQRVVEALRDKEKRQVFMRKVIIDFCATVNRFKDVSKVAMVIDSHSWRYKFYSNYKYAETKFKEDYYSDFCSMIDEIEQFFRSKGIIVSRVNGAEGDDLLYIWSIYFSQVLEERLVIITGDSDIRQIINNDVSLFNNNSKILKFYCTAFNEAYWNDYLDPDVIVESVKPFEILLYKVIMGDTSDNIPKLKKGFGNVAFNKFIDFITPYEVSDGASVLDMSQWIATRFCEFCKNLNYEDTLGKILFNVKMTWLNLSVYNDVDITYNGKKLLMNMLDDVNNNKNSFSYNNEYSLENFYGLPIK